MPALNLFGNLGAIGEGALSTEERLKRQQLQQIYTAMAQQQLQQQMQQQQARSMFPWQSLVQGQGLFGAQPGGQPGGLPPYQPGQVQQQPLVPPPAGPGGGAPSGFSPAAAPFPTQQNAVRNASSTPLAFSDVGGRLTPSPAPWGPGITPQQGIPADQAPGPAPPQAGPLSDIANVARSTAASFPQESWGTNRLHDIAAAIEKEHPDAPTAVKVMALQQMNQLLAPDDKMMLQYMINSNRDSVRMAIAELTGGIRQQVAGEQIQSRADIESSRERAAQEGREFQAGVRKDVESMREKAASDRSMAIQDRFDQRQQRAQQITQDKSAPQIRARALQDLYNQNETDIRAYMQNKPGATPENDDALHDMVIKNRALQRKMLDLLVPQSTPQAPPSAAQPGAAIPAPSS